MKALPDEIEGHKVSIIEEPDYIGAPTSQKWRWKCSCGAQGRWQWQSPEASVFGWFTHTWKALGRIIHRGRMHPGYRWLDG